MVIAVPSIALRKGEGASSTAACKTDTASVVSLLIKATKAASATPTFAAEEIKDLHVLASAPVASMANSMAARLPSGAFVRAKFNSE